MEIIVFLSIVIAVVAVLTSIVLVRRVKKQIAEMTDVLVDVKNGNGNRRILSATNELTAPLAYEINEIVVLQFVPGTSTGCSTIFAQKGIPKMEQLSARLLLTAGILLLIAGVIFAILQVWLYTDLLWAGAFGCLLAALNFRDSKNDGG